MIRLFLFVVIPFWLVSQVMSQTAKSSPESNAMSTENKQLIERFYTAFQNKDAETMAACYHGDVEFQDPAFGKLHGEQAGNMWRMLMKRGGDNLKVEFSEVEADGQSGSAYWQARYPFGDKGRKVHNKIRAKFRFKDGKIIEHRDRFNFWRWSRQALGATGLLMGWTPLVKGKVRSTVTKQLAKFAAERKAGA